MSLEKILYFLHMLKKFYIFYKWKWLSLFLYDEYLLACIYTHGLIKKLILYEHYFCILFI